MEAHEVCLNGNRLPAAHAVQSKVLTMGDMGA